MLQILNTLGTFVINTDFLIPLSFFLNRSSHIFFVVKEGCDTDLVSHVQVQHIIELLNIDIHNIITAAGLGRGGVFLLLFNPDSLPDLFISLPAFIIISILTAIFTIINLGNKTGDKSILACKA